MGGKTALVTGSSRGIGKAIAVKLAQAGADVTINYLRHKQQAEETAAAIEAEGARCLIVRANVADETEVAAMFDAIRERFGRLDVLVSNAASGILKSALELNLRYWRYTLDINAGCLLPLAQGAAALMEERGGSIVAVSSLGAVRAIPNYAAVGASKAALESLVRHLAIELAARGIRVNAVSAGVVETDALRHFPNRDTILAESRRRTPAGRLTEPDDVANTVLYLCSDLARMIVGQTVVVDGGYSVVG
ncbi:MAG: enoyl-[acyl-carrier-protein] reductase FabL [Candidatus Zixiibacteriota bacterium]|nr:MAG: enoyl-[acyl-carrier-protein] reductase FabL [candidate division Zixibacteria bacterium]